MADFVRYRMERMTEELDDLEQRGLFSPAEISEIVRRRGDFEHRLKRPCPLKQDFLDYIDYEKHLDALRVLRKKAIVGKLRRKQEEEEGGGGEDGGGKRKKKKKKGKKGTKWRSDVAGVLRILDIYRLATTRYKGDLGLWFQYLEFCRQRRNGIMKKVLAQVIRYHPKVPGLWIYAAAWEFDENLNVAAARALMQSGLRACPESEDLWIEYLRMELTYLNKLKARRVALGEDVKTLQRDNEDDQQWEKENKDLFMSLNEESGKIEKSDVQSGSLEETEDIIWKQGAAVLQIIYQGAIEALPSSMYLRQRFLEILNSVVLAQSDELKIDILEDLKNDFSHDENYWDWIARLQISNLADKKDSDQGEVLSKLDRVVQVYDEAVQVLPTAKMFSLYAQFWLELVVPGEAHISLQNKVDFDVSEISSYIINVYKKANDSGCLTEELACQYVSFLLQTGSIEEARNLAKELCSGKLSEAANLWILRASMEIRCLANKSASLIKDDLDSAFKLLRNSLTKLSIAKVEDLWLMALKFFSNDRKYFDKLVSILILALGRDSGSEPGGFISSAVVNSVLQRDGIRTARETYKQFLALPRPNLRLFKHCIGLEANLGFAGDKSGVTNARKLYESALVIYTENREMWKDYYLMEMKVGTSETANAVYSRARKVLNDATALSAPSEL